MVETRLIVGLGNPDEKYQNTRHNFGFLVIEELARQRNIKFRRDSTANGLIASFDDQGIKCFLLMPLTYMNLSGSSVLSVIRNKHVALEHTLVICDDLDIPFGQLRVRPKGSAGGHNGLRSVIEKFSTNEFPRLRMGIGRPRETVETVDFVLDYFSVYEKKKLPLLVRTAIECCHVWMTLGINEAMSQFNKRKSDE